ncbi:Clp protease N-terminal domain-containing protein [Lentzea sp. NPDC051213]|uniref:Clp protease N-terminal domain-containing protein n=1 Tax=Lentzea sp. NPDC051213 TaxID=3364126 RepID=UPI0037AFD0BF
MKHPARHVRARVIVAAQAEAQRRGDRRLSTEHLLLGLLHEPAAVEVLGVDVVAARAGLDSLDRAALAAIGINTGDFHPTVVPAATKRPPLTTAARATVFRALKPTPRAKASHPTAEQFVLALLANDRPDPAADLLAHLGVDTEAVRARLS